MTRSETAGQIFMEGFKCSQAVLEAFAEDCGLDVETARKIATPLAGGSSLGGECGAVSGAFLVLGMKYGTTDPTDQEGFQLAMAKVREFAEKFKADHRAMNCRELIGVDVFSEEGLKEFKEKNIHDTQCLGYVKDAARILEEMTAA